MNLSHLINFPIWKNDYKPVVRLNQLQKEYVRIFINKLESGEYKLVDNPCLCGNADSYLDLLISEKDRYGIPCDLVLCRNCGLIRLKRILDNKSNTEFYKNEYRYIYTGRKFPDENFFNDQYQRGIYFLKLVEKYTDISTIHNVFEIGCGSGGCLYPFYEVGKQVSGCDFNEDYLKIGISKGMNLYIGEVDFDKTSPNSQSLVILSHVLEHVANPFEFFCEAVKLVREEGYILVEVPGIFYISKIYFNPILYFQNAHVFNYYYYYYLKEFFLSFSLEILYGDERCTFLLKKPKGWNCSIPTRVYSEDMKAYAKKIENFIAKSYLIHKLKLNPYYYREMIIGLLDWLGIKDPVKRAIVLLKEKIKWNS